MINLIRIRKKLLFLTFSGLIVIILLLPIYAGFLTSVSPPGMDLSPSIIPQKIYLQNYIDVWDKTNLARNMLNGIFYASMSTAIVLAVSIPSAYAISRFRFKAKGLFLFIILSTQMLSVATIIVPLFLLVINMNLFDTYTAVIIINAALSTPLGIWYIRAYFDTVPKELDEAGMVDGCNRVQAIYKIILPICAPGLVTSAIIIFTNSYKIFFIPLVLLFSAKKYPALVSVYTLANELAPSWPMVMASAIITMLPPVILFLLARGFLTSGHMAGSLKG